MAQQVTLQMGVNYAWGNLSLVYGGNVMIGITKISFTRKQEKINNYGQGIEPVGRGHGRVTYENGSIEVYQEELKALIAAAPGRDLLQIGPGDMYLVFAGTNVLPTGDTIGAVEFTEDSIMAAEGDTKLIVSLPVIFASFKR